MAEDGEQQPIIVKKVKKGGHGHHGGAWKVAYADFVTAMMAFFLLLWLLNVTTEEQKNAISNYFDPTAPKVSEAQSGAGGVLGGLSVASKGAMASNVQQMTPPRNVKNQPRRGPKISQGEGQKQDSATSAQIAELREAEDQRFKAASQQLKAAMQKEKELAGLSENLRVDITPEGMRIQIVDREGESMFPSGSARMYDKTRNLLGKVAEVIKDMPNDISVRGHTDAVPYNPGSDYTNWELSSDRANSTRRALLEDGINETRIANVVGKADTDLLLPDKPKSPKNRRISVVLLREKLKTKKGTTGQDGARTGTPSGRTPVERDPDYERTKGKVQFP